MSKISPKFRCKVEKGRMSMDPQTKQAFDIYLKTLDGPTEAVVRPWRDEKGRSSQQNKYYWSCVLALISEHLGYTVDECHEIMKALFLPKVFKIGESSVSAYGTTTKLNTTEMESYLSQIRTWASSEIGVFIPLPNEADYDQ